MPRRDIIRLRYQNFPDAGIANLVTHGRTKTFRGIVIRHWDAVAGYLHTCFNDHSNALLNTEDVFSQACADTQRRRLDPRISWRLHLLVAARRHALHTWYRAPEAAEFRDDFRQWAQDGGSWPLSAHSYLAEAYALLPGDAQAALWHTVVERDPPVLTAQVLGVRRQDVEAVTQRARQRLRQEYLRLHHRRSAAVGRPATALTAEGQRDLADLDTRLRAQLPGSLLGWWNGGRYAEARSAAPALTGPPPALLRAR